ncbi:hypothetical protein [Streptomyces alkaliterrae]|uniref:Uncharacterized protein n=1 Tax=Streptomyces alkaliterrae TaxID=2213162 RepID=A0A5P0YST1_9ACTN|nr:hypothetical protein [Streptomyces alkaliterrae]MBB1257590.1 hypothetical protein [Streptomyces alkaliterrae]MQS03376.1 hypothetical protein [Streptomyces alkaliterrae]
MRSRWEREEFLGAAEEARSTYRDAGMDVIRGEDGQVRDSFERPWVDIAWWVYYGAWQACQRGNNWGLVIGGLRKGDVRDPDAAGIDDVLRANFPTMDETTRNLGQGAVLDSRNWSILVNDAWLLAGVHAQAPFYLASPRSEQNIVAADGRLRVFGRELAGLKSFSYVFESKRRRPELGEVAVPGGRQRADFLTYQKYADSYQAGRRWRELMR